MDLPPKIIVAIRKRPLTRKELNKKETDIVSVFPNNSLALSEQRCFN